MSGGESIPAQPRQPVQPERAGAQPDEIDPRVREACQPMNPAEAIDPRALHAYYRPSEAGPSKPPEPARLGWYILERGLAERSAGVVRSAGEQFRKALAQTKNAAQRCEVGTAWAYIPAFIDRARSGGAVRPETSAGVFSRLVKVLEDVKQRPDGDTPEALHARNGLCVGLITSYRAARTRNPNGLMFPSSPRESGGRNSDGTTSRHSFYGFISGSIGRVLRKIPYVLDRPEEQHKYARGVIRIKIPTLIGDALSEHPELAQGHEELLRTDIDPARLASARLRFMEDQIAGGDKRLLEAMSRRVEDLKTMRDLPPEYRADQARQTAPAGQQRRPQGRRPSPRPRPGQGQRAVGTARVPGQDKPTSARAGGEDTEACMKPTDGEATGAEGVQATAEVAAGTLAAMSVGLNSVLSSLSTGEAVPVDKLEEAATQLEVLLGTDAPRAQTILGQMSLSLTNLRTAQQALAETRNGIVNYAQNIGIEVQAPTDSAQ